MRVFITGGTGYLGRAITSALSAAGHEVLGLARAADKAEFLKRLGASPLLGDLRDPVTYVPVAALCDAVIHLAQAGGHDRGAVDRAAVEGFLRAGHEGRRMKALIYTSVLFVLGDTGDGPAPESPAQEPPAYVAERAGVEGQVLRAGGGTLACAVIRPGMVYGGGLGGSVSELFRGADEEGAPTYVGGGDNRWSLIHREDVAGLYRQVLERRAAGIFHAVDGHPLAVREVAGEVSRAAGTSGQTKSVALEEARAELGSFADALCLDQVADASRARALGWSPRRPDFRAAAGAAYEEWKRETGRGGTPVV